jgi:DNA-binding PadR family transcriptional regulator
MKHHKNEDKGSPQGHLGPHKHEHHGHGRRKHGRHGLHSGRKLSSSELQLLLVLLLSQQSAHGYELIKSLEERTEEFYAPSPGMIYPALTYLEEIGYTSVEVEGAKKRYQLTTEGKNYLQKNQEEAEDILTELERAGAQMAKARQTMEEDAVDATSEELEAARHSLRRAMRERYPFSAGEAKRIAGILENAVVQIRKAG